LPVSGKNRHARAFPPTLGYGQGLKPRQNILYTSAEINRLYSRSGHNCTGAPV
jgi:hypothetical protein